MHLAVVFVLAALAAMLVYAATRFILGRKANYLVGGLVFIPLLVSPWWIALLGAFAGHALAVWTMNRLRPLPSPFEELTLEEVAGTLPLYEEAPLSSAGVLDMPLRHTE